MLDDSRRSSRSHRAASVVRDQHIAAISVFDDNFATPDIIEGVRALVFRKELKYLGGSQSRPPMPARANLPQYDRGMPRTCWPI